MWISLDYRAVNVRLEPPADSFPRNHRAQRLDLVAGHGEQLVMYRWQCRQPECE